MAQLILHSNDLMLVKKCCLGDTYATDEFWHTYSTTIFNAINYYLINKRSIYIQDIYDIINDLWVKLQANNYCKLGKYKGKTKLSTWLSCVAINFTKDYIRTHRKYTEMLPIYDHRDLEDSEENENKVEPASQEKSPMNTAIDNETKQTVNIVLKSLSDYEKTLIRLKYEKGLTQEEISVILKRNPNTIAGDLSRCREKIKSMLVQLGINEHDLQ